MPGKQKYSFRCLEQNCDNRVCCTRPHVNVTLGDLSRWAAQGYIEHIFPGLIINVPKAKEEAFTIETQRRTFKRTLDGNEEEVDACIFFREDANACSIRYSRPISCRTFPLLYDGSKFIVSDKACPGIGKGEVTKESLREARELAEQEFRERLETEAALPSVYGLIMGYMLRQSAEIVSKMSKEDRERLEEIMSKTPKTGEETGAPVGHEHERGGEKTESQSGKGENE